MPTIEECKKDPSILDQNSGCCGFAATLMHLFVTKSTALKDFLNCLLSCKAYPGVPKSTRITLRLLKRQDAGILDIDAREDWMLCHGLMMLFKESSKEKSDGDWAKCETYSQLWSWAHSNLTTDTALSQPATKVKELLAANAKVNASFAQGLSYKRGDLALPSDVLPNLLQLVGVTVAGQTVIPTTEFIQAQKQTSLAQKQRNQAALTREIQQVQSGGSTSSRTWSGIILGVGDKPNDTKFQAYNNVTHWVYVPVKPNKPPASGEFKVWSWGKEFDFWDYFVGQEDYYPAVVVKLAI
ncbi:hypothetical protein [Hyalangium gracile]|uniref:hypothetical protein n=1 Tax=Hyalangium gracile TaxID=394092 RepID=UPI001CCE5110|nr:hypothetical protein [Hyalangium gracile]